MAWIQSNMKLDTLFSRKSRPAFLVGSGISIDPPSCLPAGYRFTRALLEQCLPPEEMKAILDLTDPDRPGRRGEGDFLRFEQLMGFLQESIDPDMHLLYLYAACNQPLRPFPEV